MVSKGASLASVLLVALCAVPLQEAAASASPRSDGPLVETSGKTRRQAAQGAGDLGSTTRSNVVISPCPDVLFNIRVNSNRNRWNGIISVTPEESAVGVVLDIELDRRVDLVGTTFAEVYTTDNFVHTIRDDNRRLARGQVFSVRFFVKYNASAGEPPNVKSISFNGKRICPLGEEEGEDLPATSEIAYVNSPSPTTSPSVDTNNQPGKFGVTPTASTATPPKASGAGPNNQDKVYVLNGGKDRNHNEYEVEWKGNTEELIGRLPGTPEAYVINGEFKIKSNASLLILLIARPPQTSTHGLTIPVGGITTVGGGSPVEPVESPGEVNSSGSPQTENVFEEVDGSTADDGEPPVVPAPSNEDDEDRTGEDPEEEPPFVSNAGTSEGSPIVRGEQTTARTPGEDAGEGDRDAGPPQRISPCPEVFTYLPSAPGSGTWYGRLTLTSQEGLVGIRLDIELNKPSHNLGAWLGEVTSTNNIRYSIWNSSAEIMPGQALTLRFFVKYDREDTDPPRLNTIRLNGRMICPARIETTFRSEVASEDDDPFLLIQRINLDESSSSPDPVMQEPALSTNTKQKGSEEGNSGLSREENSLYSFSRIASEEARSNEDDMSCGLVEVEQTPLASYEQRTTQGQWPWHAAIYQFRGEDRYYICGGTLIGKRAVLTAARCLSEGRPVDQESLLVYVGMHSLHRWDKHVQFKEVQEVRIHPSYNSTNLEANLAVLILSSPVELTAYVRPVCLWSEEDKEASDIRGEEGVVVGWGYDRHGGLSEDLIISKMPVLYQRACLWNFPELFRYLSEGIYCAGYKSDTNVCNGESGDGMFLPAKTEDLAGTGESGISPTWTIRGVASFALSPNNGIQCSTKNYVVFTDVTKYQDWIKNVR